MKLVARHALFVMAALACSLFFSGGNSAYAQNAIIYGVTATNNLVSFSSTNPGTFLINRPITGLQEGETILGIDFRPANGQLYALGSTSRLYTIDPATGAATPVGASGGFTLSGAEFGFDFNPVPDLIRVNSDADQNLRLNPNTGGLQGTDGTLAYDATDADGDPVDPNAGTNPTIVAAGYVNSFAGATTTTLYDIDSNLDILVIQSPPNSGTLNTVGPLGVDTSNIASMDILTSADRTTNTAFAALTVGGVSNLYTINLSTGQATRVGTTPIGGTGGPLIRGIAVAPAVSGGVIISEFRFRGPGGSQDEYIELYNATNSPITVQSDDGSAGWAIDRCTLPTAAEAAFCAGVTIIPNGQVIPARGHYLIVNPTGYSLANYGGPNAAFGDLGFADATEDIEDNASIALFTTGDFDRIDAGTATPLDQVGFFNPSGDPSNNRTFYGEGTLETAIDIQNVDFAFFRSLVSGFPQDTNNNGPDFTLVSTTALVGGTPAILGAPGPQDSLSPLQNNAFIKASIIDPNCAGVSSNPNSACAFVRIGTPVPNGSLGTLSLRRRFRNNQSVPVNRLRFRIVNITTLGNNTSEETDLRALDSTDMAVPDSNGFPVFLAGTQVEMPPAQPSGGALNSSMNVGFINPGQTIAPGGFVDVQFVLGVNQRNGRFRFLVNIEAANGQNTQ